MEKEIFKLCLICKTKIYKAKLGYGITRWKEVKYCSPKCLAKSQKKEKPIVKCSYCGKEKQIYPYELKDAIQCKILWDINNGVTLCSECHKQTPNYSFKANNNPIDNNKY